MDEPSVPNVKIISTLRKINGNAAFSICVLFAAKTKPEIVRTSFVTFDPRLT